MLLLSDAGLPQHLGRPFDLLRGWTGEHRPVTKQDMPLPQAPTGAR
jgi:hypothetical protein